MEIQIDRVVSFHYSIKEAGTSEEVESSKQDIPMAFLVGHGNILKGLEDAMLGKSSGERLTVTLEPKDAYGELQPDASKKVPIKHLVGKYKRLLPGTLVKVNTERGQINASVIKAGKFMVELDLNHPFAGKTLVFDIEIHSVREATSDEKAHGHAHGEGGHHH